MGPLLGGKREGGAVGGGRRGRIGVAFVCVDRAEFAASRRNIYAVAQTALLVRKWDRNGGSLERVAG